MWSGYPPRPGFTSSGGYWTGFVTQDGSPVAGDPKLAEKPVVFLLNSAARIPVAAVPLWKQGKAGIVFEGEGLAEMFFRIKEVTLPNGLTAGYRSGELVHPDGTTGFRPNVVVGSDGLAAALRLAKAARFPPPELERLVVSGRPPANPGYAELAYPPEGLRLLAAVRIWSAFHYFYPYKHLIGEDWDNLLPVFLAQLHGPKDATEYNLAVARIVARTNDVHSYVRGAQMDLVRGAARAPVFLRWIEGRAVATALRDDGEAQESGIRIGDIILKVDGRDVAEKIDFVRRHYSNSTPQALMWRAMWRLLDGPEGTPVKVTVQGVDGVRELELPRSRKYDLIPSTDRAGEIIRFVADGIGYVDLDRLPPGRVNEMLERFKDSRAIIMDMRGYPQGTAFQIAPRLATRENVVFAQVRRNRVTAWESQSEYVEWRLGSRPGPKYSGQTALLIDEGAVSQAEHSGLMFRAANGTKFIGTPTMGANGDVTNFLIPGGISISFSAHDVRHADGSQLQRVGLRPDIEVPRRSRRSTFFSGCSV